MCDGFISYKLTLNQHIFIELECDFHETKNISTVTYRLRNFPVRIIVKKNLFSLKSVTSLIKPLMDSSTGLYRAYCRRLDGMWELYDDLKNKITVVSSNTEANPHLLLYTV